MNKNKWLESIRLEKDLTHDQVAVLANIDRSYYTKIENGLTPSVKVSKKIAQVLGFSWTIFFEEKCAKSAQ
ncbi:helix-turn-helix transcriptional regulator [Priestia flexa]|uniref:Helix-turn-helix transcriptional regulator n=1 Tax=Priestia flexa TaxID=86664 RepID=A0ABU4J4E4_9BACI|nr:helix-turn-helix transcriptional regulator [Priestia flexa]MDW8515852.1 helix-turn-helix transcriptional regulator [Priestia flexa]